MANLETVTPQLSAVERAETPQEVDALAAKAREKIATAKYFAELTEHPLWGEAFEAIEKEIKDQIFETEPDQPDARERAYVLSKACQTVRVYLESLAHGTVTAETVVKKAMQKSRRFTILKKD